MNKSIRLFIKEGIINKNIDINTLIDKAKKEYKNKGFFIAKNLIDDSCYQECRRLALDYFINLRRNENNIKLPYALRGDVPAGMKDFVGFTDNKSWNLYRYCHFPWNRADPSLKILFDTSFALSQIRNIFNGNDISYGELIEDNDYITYSSLSLYPPEGGFLKKHKDHQPTHKNPSLLHTKIELTHKGSDYNDGGFYVYDRSCNKIDISSLINPGDVIFFDGTQSHQIDPIKNSEFGRIALFDIPTYVRKTSRLNIYSGDGFSSARKILTKFANILP